MAALLFLNFLASLAVLAALFNPKGILMSLAQIKEDLAALRTSVQANTVKDAAIAELFNGYKAKIADLQGQLDTAIANSASPEELQAISDDLKAVHQEMDGQNAAADALLNT